MKADDRDIYAKAEELDDSIPSPPTSEALPPSTSLDGSDDFDPTEERLSAQKEAILEHERRREIRRLERPRYIVIGVLALVLAAIVFQLFFRYEYVVAGRLVLRIDRLTQHTCRVGVDCETPRIHWDAQ